MLPNFKGTSVTRWQKFYNPKFIGATLHYLNQDLILEKLYYKKKLIISLIDSTRAFERLIYPANFITLKFFNKKFKFLKKIKKPKFIKIGIKANITINLFNKKC